MAPEEDTTVDNTTWDSKYFLEGDTDRKRLRAQHPIIKHNMGGKLILAPLDFSEKDLRILDSGTSDGTLLLDLRSDLLAAHPDHSHNYTGIDIDSTRFPHSTPPNVSLLQQDILQPFPSDWQGSFDLLHQRLVLAIGSSNIKDLFERELELVKPGGWVQFVEAEHTCDEDDGLAMRQFLKLMKAIFNMMGAAMKFHEEMEGWLKEEGFVNVGKKVVQIGFGVKCTDEKLVGQSVQAFGSAAAALVEFGKSLGFEEETLGFPKEELNTLVQRFTEELETQGASFPLRVVWGQKPLR